MMSCLEARRLAPRFVALELAPELERELRAHLAGCLACRDVVTARDPALTFAWAVATKPGPPDDERFVGEVMAQIHQRRLERKMVRVRSRLLAAAAALLVAFFGGAVVVRQLVKPAATADVQASAVASHTRPVAADPAFVEVDGDGVWLYELTPASQSGDAIQVAFIVDPHLEL
ncbi:MAG: zf-HC2 domain-containing protein [Acidobacteriia bacterium]|nr:zf-HC2 domain-containing protein [Terriglobia bacterium]